MKFKLLSLMLILPILAIGQSQLEYFEFNETSNAGFNQFANSGSNASSWNFGGPATIVTDGNGNLQVGGILNGTTNGPITANGNAFRKIDYAASPYTSGVYNLEFDLTSAALDAADADANIKYGVGSAIGSANNIAWIGINKDSEGAQRIQFFAASTNSVAIYRNWNTTSGQALIQLDLDNNTVSFSTNGVALTGTPLPLSANTSIAAMQWNAQNLDAASTASINSMGFVDVNGTPGGGGDDGGADSTQGSNENTDASSHWDFDANYGSIALEKFTYNESGKQFAAVGQSFGPSNEGTLGSGFNFGGGGDNRTDTDGNVTFYGKGGTRSDGAAPSTLYRIMPSNAGYAEGTMPTTGVLSFVVDLDSWNLDPAALETGAILDIAAYNGDPGNQDVLTGVTVNAHTNGQGRIQVRSSIAGATSPAQYRTLYFPLTETSLPKVTVELDLDNDTVVYLTNDVVWQQAPSLTNINASAELTHIRFGMGNVGTTNSTIKVDGFAVYQRVAADEVTKLPVVVDGSEFSGSSVYMGGTNFVLNFASTNVASAVFTNGLVNAGQDYYLGAYHSTVIAPEVLADLALNSAVTNDGGGRGAVVLSSHGANSWQHGGFRIQEQSLQNGLAYNQLAPTAGSTSDGVVIYTQDSFRDGLSSGNVAFEADADTLSVELDFAGKQRMSEARFSWVVQDNGVYYRSQPITMTHGANEANVATANTLTNLTAEALDVAWYAYDETAIDVNNIGNAASPTLQKIGAIGYVYGVTWTGETETGGNWARYQVQSFSSEGAVPAVVAEIDTWLSQNGLSVTSGDADGDGRVDLLEYALGTDPAVSDSASISGALSGANIAFTHAKRAGIDHGLTYTVQTNANLKFPVWGDSSTVSASESGSSVTHTIETATEDALFIRLKVELDD